MPTAKRRGRVALGQPLRLVTPSAISRENSPIFFSDGFTLDQEHLANVREVDVPIERRTAPNVASIQRLLLAARLDATMVARRDLDKIRGIALVEQQPDIAF